MYPGTLTHVAYLTGSSSEEDDYDLDQPFLFQIWRPDVVDTMFMELVYETTLPSDLSDEGYHEVSNY